MESNTDHLKREPVEIPNDINGTGVVRWKVGNGAEVVSGDTLGIVEEPSGRKHPLVTMKNGKVDLIVGEGEPVKKIVAAVVYCSHPIKSRNMCMFCLKRVEETSGLVPVMFADGKSLHMNVETAQQLDFDNISRQLRSKKLSLVLDLDHTLLHATVSPEAESVRAEEMYAVYLSHGPQTIRHFIKLRPNLRNFLGELEPLFDLHIYTHGTREYAEQIARIIDPTGALFRHRIVSR